MKNIGIITTSRVFAQGLAVIVKERPELEFKPFLLLNPHQALIDAEIMQIDVAVIDITDNASKNFENMLHFCEELRKNVPGCHILLLVSQENGDDCKMAIEAVKSKTVEDFVLYDASLEYLFAKLAAF